MDKEKFINFLDALQKNGADDSLFESIKTAFKVCFENYDIINGYTITHEQMTEMNRLETEGYVVTNKKDIETEKYPEIELYGEKNPKFIRIVMLRSDSDVPMEIDPDGYSQRSSFDSIREENKRKESGALRGLKNGASLSKPKPPVPNLNVKFPPRFP